MTGRDGIERMLRANVIVYDDGTPRTNHVTTNLAIEVDEMEAQRCRVRTSPFCRRCLTWALEPVVSGGYFDRFERRDGPGVLSSGALGPILSAMSPAIFVAFLRTGSRSCTPGT